MSHRDEFMVVLTENKKLHMEWKDFRGHITTVSLTLNWYVWLGSVSHLLTAIWGTETAVLSYPHALKEHIKQQAGISLMPPSFARISSWPLPSRICPVTNSSPCEVNSRMSLTLTRKKTDTRACIYWTIFSNFVTKADLTPYTNSGKYNGWIIPSHTKSDLKMFSTKCSKLPAAWCTIK